MKATTTDFTKRKVYISGNRGGLMRVDIENLFKESAEYLRSKGYNPIYILDHNLPAGSTSEQCVATKILTLLDCDAVFMQDDWKDSRGARLEYEIAYSAGKPIYQIGEDGMELIV
jgi:hypothetical protein